MSIKLNFPCGFKGIQEFREIWRNSESLDDPGPVLAQLYTCATSPMSKANLNVILKGTFTRFCNCFWYNNIKSVLAEEPLRLSVEELHENCLSILFSNLFRNRGPSYVENKLDANETLLVLMNNSVFVSKLTELELQHAIQVRDIDKDVIKRLIEISGTGIFDITSSTCELIQHIKQQRPADLNFKTISDLVKGAYERKVVKVGHFENSGVITDRKNCRHQFPSPFEGYDHYSSGAYPYTRIELYFNSISAAIRRKDNWKEKCCNPDILNKWRQELSGNVSDMKLFDLVIEQLLLLRQIGHDRKFEISPVENVYQSDTLLSDDLKLMFRELVYDLEMSSPVDFHPGSKNKVVDIVHPSLYPAVADVTRIRDNPVLTLLDSWTDNLGSLGLATLKFKQRNKYNDQGWSYNFNWIPAEFYVDDMGGVNINSYINNLHPSRYSELYGAIGDIFSRALPLVEQVLSECVFDEDKITKLRLVPNPGRCDMYDPFTLRDDLSQDSEDQYEEYYENRVPKPIPLPETFPSESFSHYLTPKVTLRDKRLQVIVKVAKIELTPQDPTYDGGAWHIEGMKNEDIVSTVIYYYSCENITESRLNFRQAIREPFYEQNDVIGTESWYGLRDDDPLNQELGGVVVKEGRIVAFPNTMQHCVQPFELQDKTKRGHRKILVYFLVNPMNRIVSTASIPPQILEWASFHPQSPLHLILNSLGVSDDVVAYIFTYLDFPMHRTEAEQIRESLMHERSYFVDEFTAESFERPFSLCEH